MTTTTTKVRDAIQMWTTDDLIAGIACTRRGSWLARLMANELVSRGAGHDGGYVGPKYAATLWVDADQ